MPGTKFYTEVMMDAIKHIIEAHLIHRALTRVADEQQAKSARGATHISYEPLVYPPIGNCIRIQVVAHVHPCPKIVAQHPVL